MSKIQLKCELSYHNIHIMPYYKTKAFTLVSNRYMESDRIVTFFTYDSGKVPLIIKGVRRTKSHFGSVAEPFTQSTIMFYKSTPDKLGVVEQTEIAYSNSNIRETYIGMIVLGYIASLLDVCLESYSQDTGIYHLIEHLLFALGSKQDIEKSVMIFEWRLIAILGYRPEINKCHLCGSPLTENTYIDLKYPTVLYGQCCYQKTNSGIYTISSGSQKFLNNTLCAPLKETMRYRLMPSTRKTLRTAIRYMILYHIPYVQSKRSAYEKEIQRIYP